MSPYRSLDGCRTRRATGQPQRGRSLADETQFSARVFVTQQQPSRDVDEVVLVFVRQRFRRAITPEVKLLKGFTKVAVKAGQEARAMVTLMTEDLSYWSPELRRFGPAAIS